jgi:hypothetical protein
MKRLTTRARRKRGQSKKRHREARINPEGQTGCCETVPARACSEPSPMLQRWTEERMHLITALGDLLRFYDRAAGNPGHTGHGWSVAEVLRLEEIRNLACPERLAVNAFGERSEG